MGVWVCGCAGPVAPLHPKRSRPLAESGFASLACPAVVPLSGRITAPKGNALQQTEVTICIILAAQVPSLAGNFIVFCRLSAQGLFLFQENLSDGQGLFAGGRVEHIDTPVFFIDRWIA